MVRTFQFATLFGAGALVQQTFDVIGEHSVVAEHRFNTDCIVLLLVLVGGDGRQATAAAHQHGQQNGGGRLHGAGGGIVGVEGGELCGLRESVWCGVLCAQIRGEKN